MKIEDKEKIAEFLGYESEYDNLKDITYWYYPTDGYHDNRLYIDDLKFNNWKTIGKLLKKIEKEEGIHTDFHSCFYSKNKKSYSMVVRKNDRIIANLTSDSKNYKKAIFKTIIKYIEKENDNK